MIRENFIPDDNLSPSEEEEESSYKEDAMTFFYCIVPISNLLRKVYIIKLWNHIDDISTSLVRA